MKFATGGVTGGLTFTVMTADLDDEPALLDVVRMTVYVLVVVVVKVWAGFLSVTLEDPSPKFHW